MEYGICTLAAITCKAESNHKSEQINQLLFGEYYSVLEKTTDWYRIIAAHDNYEGWIHRKHHTAISEQEFELLQKDKPAIALDLLTKVFTKDGNDYCNFPIGSSLPFYNQQQFKINEESFYSTVEVSDQQFSNTTKYSRLYLNTPYLWGGRTPMGIDCSGLVQMTFKLCGIKLPRDSWQQEMTGTKINSLSEAKEGDLVFFGNETKINHVGLLLNNTTVIHASGKVKIEKIDEKGIIGNVEKDYTHFLKSIKRI